MQGRVFAALLLAGFLLDVGEALPFHAHTPDLHRPGESVHFANGDAPLPAPGITRDPHERHPIGSVIQAQNCFICPSCRNGSFLPPEIDPVRSGKEHGPRLHPHTGVTFASLVISSRGIRAPPTA